LFLDFTPKCLIPLRENMMYISTSPFPHSGDVRCHNYPLLDPASSLVTLMGLCTLSHLKLDSGFDTICNSPLQVV
jgi:hypothetical protein